MCGGGRRGFGGCAVVIVDDGRFLGVGDGRVVGGAFMSHYGKRAQALIRQITRNCEVKTDEESKVS